MDATTNHLLRTEGMSKNNRHPDGIMYGKIGCDITITKLYPAVSSVHPYTYIIRLQNETITVEYNRTPPNNVNLSTFHGPVDWAQSNEQVVFNHVFNNPKSLSPPAISDQLADANINMQKAMYHLEQATLEATWPLVMKNIFDQI